MRARSRSKTIGHSGSGATTWTGAGWCGRTRALAISSGVGCSNGLHSGCVVMAGMLRPGQRSIARYSPWKYSNGSPASAVARSSTRPITT